MKNKELSQEIRQALDEMLVEGYFNEVRAYIKKDPQSLPRIEEELRKYVFKLLTSSPSTLFHG